MSSRRFRRCARASRRWLWLRPRGGARSCFRQANTAPRVPRPRPPSAVSTGPPRLRSLSDESFCPIAPAPSLRLGPPYFHSFSWKYTESYRYGCTAFNGSNLAWHLRRYGGYECSSWGCRRNTTAVTPPRVLHTSIGSATNKQRFACHATFQYILLGRTLL